MKVLKFALRYKFIKRRQGGLNFASQARNCGTDTKSVPLSPFKIPCLLAVTRQVTSKTTRTLEVHAIIITHCMQSRTLANFKIRAGISRFQIQWQVTTRPEFGKLLRRVSKVLKFANLPYQIK